MDALDASSTEEKEKKYMKRKERKRKKLVLERKKKEFTYRGYTLDRLQSMTVPELLPLLPARARRSLKRGFNEEEEIFVKKLINWNKEKPLKTHHRQIIILPKFVGKKVAVHNGKEWKVFEIKPEMIGHYLGEFALTRKFVAHSGPGVGATRSSKFLPLK